MTKKLTTERFIEKAKAIHGDMYDYSIANCDNIKEKISIICKLHGIFHQRYDHHLNGHGCKLCSHKKRKDTCFGIYGVENPAQSKEIKDKIKKTNIERYGVENTFSNKEIQTKIKNTNLERYGVEYVAQNKQVYAKVKKTNLERYGVEYAAQNKEVYDKVKSTNIERYGVENPTQNKEVYDKVKSTNIERYGVECTLQSKYFKNEWKQKHGYLYPRQIHMKDILSIINNYGWLFEQYISLGKTSKQIAQELGVDGTTICNYLKKHEIEIRYVVGYSMKAIQWLESIMEEQNIFIQHAGNIGEYKIPGTRYRVDGYCQETNTVYEFHGDIFHGNPSLFEEHETPNFYKPEITAKELYIKTKEREQDIIDFGYNLVTIWENDFNRKINE